MVNKSLHQDPRLVFSAQEASRFLQKHFDVQHIAHPQPIYKAIKKGELRATNCDEYGLRGKSYTLEKEELIRWFTNKYVTAVA